MLIRLRAGFIDGQCPIESGNAFYKPRKGGTNGNGAKAVKNKRDKQLIL